MLPDDGERGRRCYGLIIGDPARTQAALVFVGRSKAGRRWVAQPGLTGVTDMTITHESPLWRHEDADHGLSDLAEWDAMDAGELVDATAAWHATSFPATLDGWEQVMPSVTETEPSRWSPSELITLHAWRAADGSAVAFWETVVVRERWYSHDGRLIPAGKVIPCRWAMERSGGAA